MSTYSSAPPSRALSWTVSAVMLHAVLWAGVFLGLVLIVPRHVKIFQNFNMKLPAMSEFLVALSVWVGAYFLVALATVILLLVVDGILYFRLRRRYSNRVPRRLWSAVMMFVPLAGIVWVVVGMWYPLYALNLALGR